MVAVYDAKGSKLKSVNTDGLGFYLTRLPPGKFRLEATADRYSVESATVTLEAQREPRLPRGRSRKSLLADSVADWSNTGRQGFNGWSYGYYNRSADKDGRYQPGDLVLFPHDGAGWSPTDFWDGTGWNWFAGDPPWTTICREYEHPNSPNGWWLDPTNPAHHEHWVIRRWTSTANGKLNLICHLNFCKENAGEGDGVIAYVFREGAMIYSNAISSGDLVGVSSLLYLPDVKRGERIDVALAPGNTDYADGTLLSAIFFSRPRAFVQDFALRTPLASVFPAALDFEVEKGTTQSRRLKLRNLGGLELKWTLRDSATARVASPKGTGVMVYRSGVAMSASHNAGKTAPVYPTTFRWVPVQPSAALNILIYADDAYHVPPYSYLDQALQRLALPYVACYYGDWSGFETVLPLGAWDLVLVGNDNWIPPLSALDALNSYVLGGGKLVYHGWTVSRCAGHPLWTTLGITWKADDFDPPAAVYWWDREHMIFNDPERVPEFTAPVDGRYGIYGQQVEPLAGFEPPAGFTTPGPDPNQAAMVLGNHGRTVFKAFLDGQNDGDLDADGTLDGVELWVNLIAGILAGFPRDIAWLTENPMAGTVVAHKPQEVEVSVNASTLLPGDYFASLTIANNSGRTDKLVVPVKIKVLPRSAPVNARLPLR